MSSFSRCLLFHNCFSSVPGSTALLICILTLVLCQWTSLVPVCADNFWWYLVVPRGQTSIGPVLVKIFLCLSRFQVYPGSLQLQSAFLWNDWSWPHKMAGWNFLFLSIFSSNLFCDITVFQVNMCCCFQG